MVCHKKYDVTLILNVHETIIVLLTWRPVNRTIYMDSLDMHYARSDNY
jgi:hypothetical protein